jgi:hypothetical protein
VGFEPTASWSRTRRSTKLSHSPKCRIYSADVVLTSRILRRISSKSIIGRYDNSKMPTDGYRQMTKCRLWQFCYWSSVAILFGLAAWKRFTLPLEPIADPDTWGYLSPALRKLTGAAFGHTSIYESGSTVRFVFSRRSFGSWPFFYLPKCGAYKSRNLVSLCR